MKNYKSHYHYHYYFEKIPIKNDDRIATTGVEEEGIGAGGYLIYGQGFARLASQRALRGMLHQPRQNSLVYFDLYLRND